MKQTISSVAVVAAVTASCGSASDDAGGTLPAVTSTEMSAPRAIEIADEMSLASESGDVASDSMLASAALSTEFEAGPGLGELPTASTGYLFDADATPDRNDIAALATVLGIGDDVTEDGDGFATWWHVGPEDSTGPALEVFDDAEMTWRYDWGSVAHEAPQICETFPDVVPVDSSDVPFDLPAADHAECVATEPPAGLLTESDAETAAMTILSGLGVPSTEIETEVTSDEYRTVVTAARTTAPGLRISNWGFHFGEDGALVYAYGQLADPEPVGPWELIDIDDAVERLADQAHITGVVGPDVAIDEPMIDPPTGSEPSTDDTMVDEPMVDPADESTEPAGTVATLVDVDADLYWVLDTTGDVWLLPAYRFTSDTGAIFTIPAVTDDMLSITTTPTTLPAPTAGDDGIVIFDEPVVVGEPAVVEEVSVEVVSVTDDVEFYPACMNGTVEVDGVVWYPVAEWGNDELADLHAKITGVNRVEPLRAEGLVRVAAPGPGDDVGTLIVWADGVARFTSESGNVAWLVADDISDLIDWVC